MLLRRSASIYSAWRQQGEVLLLARSLSGSPANEELNLSEFAQQPKPSETLFGIAPLKSIDEEDEDFVPPTPPSTPPFLANESKQQNYFSKTWAMQKRIIVGESNIMGEELAPSSPSSGSSQLIVAHRSSLKRVWQVAPDSQTASHETFKFVTLKVLCTDIAQKHRTQLYRYISVSELEWKNRRKKLLDDLDELAADIICLQELDKFDDLKPHLSWRGYVGLYKVSTKASSSGCAIFWKQKRFKLLHEKSIDFHELDLRDNVAQLCVFQSIVPGTADDGAFSDVGIHNHNHRKCLLVGNINCLFNPRRGEIKLGQCRAFLQQAHKLLNEWPGAPLVIGGCFHATPQSLIYKFIAESKVDVSGFDSRSLCGRLVKDEKAPRSPATMSGTGKHELSVDLYQRLRNSLLARTKKQDTRAGSFKNSTSLSSFPSPVHGNNAAAEAFVAKTVGILETSIIPQEALNKLNQNAGGVNASPGTAESSESNTESNSDSLNRKSVEPCGSTVEPSISSVSEPLSQLSGVEAPSDDCPAVTPDPAKDASSVASATTHDSSESSITAEHGWDPEALKLMSASDNCTMIKHDLKLFSVYPEVQGKAMTRDSKGEPCITMMHSEFKGTVDYIWRSEGLKTMKVLDTFSENEMLVTPSIPFVASGSDHVSLACELGFLKSQVEP